MFTSRQLGRTDQREEGQTQVSDLRAKVDMDRLVDQQGPALYRFCRSLAFSKEDGEDLFQDTFLKAAERPEKLAEDPRRTLFSTALSLWRSRKRKIARRQRLAPTGPLPDTPLPGGTDPAETVLAREEAARVRAVTAALPERYRLPLVLYYGAEMKINDIATTLSLPVGTVKRRLFTAREMVEKGLAEDE